MVRLGDGEVEYDPSFKLYLSTCLLNPHYLPEVCIKVNLVNFTVTRRVRVRAPRRADLACSQTPAQPRSSTRAR
jgi:hypothetical protein